MISNGGIAHAIVTFAYSEERADRISAFIVDTDGPGIEREELSVVLAQVLDPQHEISLHRLDSDV